MEKLMYLLWKKKHQTDNEFKTTITHDVIPLFQNLSAKNIRLTLVDSDVEQANNLFINRGGQANAVLSFWLDSALGKHAYEESLNTISEKHCGYLVTESEPVTNTQHINEPTIRTYGMNQVVFFQKLKTLDREQWLDIWLNSHTQIAIETQSTFGYRQNIITRKLTENALDIDAIVEENFPPEAMNSPQHFFNAVNDECLLKKRQTDMFNSVQRFINLETLICLPMSEYNF